MFLKSFRAPLILAAFLIPHLFGLPLLSFLFYYQIPTRHVILALIFSSRTLSLSIANILSWDIIKKITLMLLGFFLSCRPKEYCLIGHSHALNIILNSNFPLRLSVFVSLSISLVQCVSVFLYHFLPFPLFFVLPNCRLSFS